MHYAYCDIGCLCMSPENEHNFKVYGNIDITVVLIQFSKQQICGIVMVMEHLNSDLILYYI